MITRFKCHPSIIAIDQNRSDEIFDFTLYITDVVSSEIRKLDPAKSTTGTQ